MGYTLIGETPAYCRVYFIHAETRVEVRQWCQRRSNLPPARESYVGVIESL